MSDQQGQAPGGRVLTVIATKGGCGRTTLATNLAVVLNAGGARSVCLVDLDLAFGDIATVLAVEPTRGLAQLADFSLTPDTVDSLVTPIWPNLDGVLVPAVPGGAAAMSAAMVGDLLALLATRYAHVVVDTPARISGHVLAALDASTDHLLVTTPERPALRSLRATLDILDLLGYEPGSRSVVLNRGDSQVGLTREDVLAILRTEPAAELPSTVDIPVSVNRGVPLALEQPEHDYSRAVAGLVRQRLGPTGAWRW
jgi:Flp pilus assembly CpaE family ATPase